MAELGTQNMVETGNLNMAELPKPINPVGNPFPSNPFENPTLFNPSGNRMRNVTIENLGNKMENGGVPFHIRIISYIKGLLNGCNSGFILYLNI